MLRDGSQNKYHQQHNIAPSDDLGHSKSGIKLTESEIDVNIIHEEAMILECTPELWQLTIHPKPRHSLKLKSSLSQSLQFIHEPIRTQDMEITIVIDFKIPQGNHMY